MTFSYDNSRLQLYTDDNTVSINSYWLYIYLYVYVWPLSMRYFILKKNAFFVCLWFRIKTISSNFENNCWHSYKLCHEFRQTWPCGWKETVYICKYWNNSAFYSFLLFHSFFFFFFNLKNYIQKKKKNLPDNVGVVAACRVDGIS